MATDRPPAAVSLAGVRAVSDGDALRRFVGSLRDVLGWRILPAIGLPLALGASEGAAVLLLVPLLGQIGVDVRQGGSALLAGVVESAFARLGIPVTLTGVLSVFVLVSTVHALASRWQIVFHPALDRAMLTWYRERLYRAFLRADWAFAVTGRPTDQVHALMTDVEKVSTLTYQCFTIASGAILLAVYTVLALRISAAMTIVVGVCGLVLMALQRRRGDEAARAAAAYSNASGALHMVAAESLSGLKTVKSYGAEAATERVVRSIGERLAASYVSVIAGHARSKLVFDIGSSVALAAVLYVSIAVLALPAASLLLVLLFSARLMPRIVSLHAGAQLCRTSLPGLVRVLTLLDAYDAHADRRDGAATPLHLDAHVRFDGVSFRYGPDRPLAADAVDLRIDAGRTTAIVGPSGGGKSTLADLLLGLLTPSAGQVLVDGRPLGPSTRGAWLRSIGYVAQDTFLFNDTIAANMRWAHPDATDAAIWEALAHAAAQEFVQRLPDGLQTVVGDRGVRLSGGERQRLALARALLRRPSLLVLDEATSALDSEHERRIQDAVEGLHGRLTIVIITHRLTTVRAADAIHVVDQGRVVETGTWDSLLRRPGGRFRALCEAQQIVPPESLSPRLSSAGA